MEISEAQLSDRGVYKLVAKNEKGEAVSKTVEVKDIPAEEPEKLKSPEKTQELSSKDKETKTKKVEGSKPCFAKPLENMVTFSLYEIHEISVLVKSLCIKQISP